MLDIAKTHTMFASDPLVHSWKFCVLAEFAPSGPWVDLIYATANEFGAVNPDLEAIVERRLTGEFAR